MKILIIVYTIAIGSKLPAQPLDDNKRAEDFCDASEHAPSLPPLHCAHLRHVLHAGARSATAHAHLEGDIVQIFGAKLSELKDLNLYCARCQTFKSRILY